MSQSFDFPPLWLPPKPKASKATAFSLASGIITMIAGIAATTLAWLYIAFVPPFLQPYWWAGIVIGKLACGLDLSCGFCALVSDTGPQRGKDAARAVRRAVPPVHRPDRRDHSAFLEIKTGPAYLCLRAFRFSIIYVLNANSQQEKADIENTHQFPIFLRTIYDEINRSFFGWYLYYFPS